MMRRIEYAIQRTMRLTGVFFVRFCLGLCLVNGPARAAYERPKLGGRANGKV